MAVYETSSSYSPRMGKSRAVYARKLLAAYPDDPARSMYYTSDLLLPRFYRPIAAECRKALRANDADAFRAARADLDFISGFLSPAHTGGREAKDLLISAVIPLYNGARTIEQALRSIFRQSLPAAEIIVVDDGSTDDGAAIVERLAREHPVKLFRKENGGQSSARNYGIARAGGDFIALLDQDDVWYPNHLERLAQPFVEPRVRELGWVYSNLDEIDEDGRRVADSCPVQPADPAPQARCVRLPAGGYVRAAVGVADLAPGLRCGGRLRRGAVRLRGRRSVPAPVPCRIRQ